MDHTTLAKLWNEAWTGGLWASSWEKSVEDLTPEQAAWNSAPMTFRPSLPAPR